LSLSKIRYFSLERLLKTLFICHLELFERNPTSLGKREREKEIERIKRIVEKNTKKAIN